MADAASTLESRLGGEAVKEDGIVDAALREANQCLFCGPRTAVEMRKFSKMFAATIDRVITNVSDIALHFFETSER